jgi:hypothetical protein
LPEISLPSDQRAQGTPGARCTRGLVCKSAQRKAHTSIQVQRRRSGIPCAMVLTLIARSPRRIGLCCLRRLRIWFCPPGRARKTSADLTPTSEASGPHAFAVRVVAVRLRAGPIAHGNPPCDHLKRAGTAASTAPRPAYVTIMIRPSLGVGWQITHSLICISEKQKYFYIRG